MKILAFTDVHGNDNLIKEVIKKSKSDKPDLLVCCGDLTIFGDNIEKVLMKFNNLNNKVLIIPGNHEEGIDLKKICKKFKNIIYLHKDIYEINGFSFFGFGTGGFSSKSLEFETLVKKIDKKIEDKKIILVTHQPPYGNKLDYLEHFEHAGNKSFRKFILKNKPMLSISGHLHENFGKMDNIGKTILINPGPLGRIIEI